jgi:hypothetical protein
VWLDVTYEFAFVQIWFAAKQGIKLINRLLQTKRFIGRPTHHFVHDFGDLGVVFDSTAINAVNRVAVGFEQPSASADRKKAFAEGEDGVAIEDALEP